MKRSIGLCGIICLAAHAAPPQHTCEAINLDQGWTPEQSEKFWFTSQGSRMMPYSRNGHEFGTTLPVPQKKDLLEYLKTL